MKRNIVLIAAAGYALAALASVAVAATPKAAAKKVATMKCPSCGMPMPTHKTATMTVPIKVGKVTYYCCSECPSGKKALAALHSKKKTM